MSATEIKVNIDDTYMNVIKFGNGSKNLVIIAGVSLCGLEGLGEAIAGQYNAFANDYTVYVIDRKKKLSEGYSVQQMAEDAYRILNEVGVKKTCLYGVSQGGMIAQCIAIYHPEMVEKLVLCSTLCKVTEKMKNAVKSWTMLAEKKNVVDINRSFFELVYSKAYLEKYKEMLPVLEKNGTAEDCDRFKVMVLSDSSG